MEEPASSSKEEMSASVSLAEANVAAPILLVRTPTVPTVEEQSVRPVPERDDEFSDWEFV